MQSFFANPVFRNLNPKADYDTIMAAAGLDFIPEKKVYTWVDATGASIPSRFSCPVTRLIEVFDAEAGATRIEEYELGSVGLKYGLVPYPTSFSFVEDLCANGEAYWKSAAPINHGAKAFLILETDDVLNLGSGLDIRNTFMLMSSHDGTCKVSGKSVPYSSYNGVVLPVPGSDFNIEVKHTNSAESRLVDLKKTMKSVRVAWEEAEAVFKQATLVEIDNEKALFFLQCVFGEPKSTRSENILNEILALWQGAGIAAKHPACRGTLFGMVMAVGEYCDHHKVVRKSKKVSEDEAHLLATLTGEAARQKAAAFGTMFKMMNL